MTKIGFFSPEILKEVENINGKVSSFFMDYFGYKEARVFTDTNYCIHLYWNGKINIIDFYKGNNHICRSEILSSKWEWIHLCKDKITSKFYIRCDDGKKLRGIPFNAVFPHNIGKKIRIKNVCIEEV